VTRLSPRENISAADKVRSLYQVAAYRPPLTAGIILLSIFAALLEGLGLSFLIPVIEIAQNGGGGGSGASQLFVRVYDFVGVPFTLESVIAGVGLVMVVRYSSSFLVAWFKSALRTDYIRYLQSVGFESALDAEVSYYDEHGSDEILNAIVTQTEYAGDTIQYVVKIIEQGFISLMYVSIAFYLAPWLTLFTGIVLGGFLYMLRYILESGYSVGGRVAEANEQVQRAVQAGTQGIREVKLFGLAEELFNDFSIAVNQFAQSSIRLRRNEALIDNFYQMITAVTVFGLIYVAISFASLSLATLGVFLFAMFRLAPRVSTLNNFLYKLDGDLPHLVRTQEFVGSLKEQEELDDGTQSPPEEINRVSFDEVTFGYNDETVLNGLSFEASRGDFIAFVGSSGAGKSTIVSLLTRLYEPDSGEIVADGTPINQYYLDEWRAKMSVVRQDPHIFNDTLEYNITLGNRDADEDEIQQVCEVAQVIEFLEDLPNGLQTELGDEGVRLSGGQRQRVAIARALLRDADILMLDEATSDLDSNIEEQVHTAIEEMDRDYMMFVIAHRLSTVVNADRIYALEDGQVMEAGRHSELIEQGGRYAELYATQARD
jgi:subfamily B ATP-binding cassette protein MsbA